MHFVFIKKDLTRATILKDDKGRTLPAMTVFSMVIDYLKNDMMGPCQQTLSEGDFGDKDVLWIITVPAIWNDSAKQFMRECAILVYADLALFDNLIIVF